MGRSGTTIIFEAFVSHPDLGYLSNYTNKFFRFPRLGLIHRAFLTHGQKKQGQKVAILNKIYPKPAEAYQTWEYLLGKKFRDTFLKDISPIVNEINRVKHYVGKLFIWQNKKRFATKLTGPPRIMFLSKIFSDAIFIDIVRDPRAVIASLINVDFMKRKGLDKPYWKDSLTENHKKILDKYNKSPIALAALEWCSVCEQTAIEKRTSGPRYLKIKYEDFIENPNKILNKIYSFVNLRLFWKSTEYINKIQYKNMNYKYLNRLTKQEIKIIEDICYEQMIELGYS